MHDERRSKRQDDIDQRTEATGAVRSAMFAVVFFSAVVLINGVLVILMIALLQTLGLWGADMIETPVLPADDPEGVRSTILALLRRPAAAGSHA